MLISRPLVTVITLAAGACAQDSLTAGCVYPETRKEWRQLSLLERKNYVDAVRCLTTKPSRIGLNTSLHDDFPYVHAVLNKQIHLVASFLPWHRYFVHIYEQALRDCGYQGSATYWDWMLDSSNPANSSIWDPATGFGGSGGSGSSPNSASSMPCLTDGPFKDFRPAYGRRGFQPHCLSRDFNNGTSHPGDMSGPEYDEDSVLAVQTTAHYDSYRKHLEGGPHKAVHRAIGGDMTPATSPNDPIFFLHHGQIDRLWYYWQLLDPATRLDEYTGIRTRNQSDGAASVDDMLPMLGLADDLPVRDFMSTQNGALLCYQY